MGNQTSFSLEENVACWRAELQLEESLSEDRLRELEGHLRDSIANWKEKGLSEEEAFWLARRRMGTAKAITAEYAKSEPTSTWRNRAFWMFVGIWGGNLYSTMLQLVKMTVHRLTWPKSRDLVEFMISPVPRSLTISLFESTLLLLLMFWAFRHRFKIATASTPLNQRKLALIIVMPILFSPIALFIQMQVMHFNPLASPMLWVPFMYVGALITNWSLAAGLIAIWLSPFKNLKQRERHA